MPMLQGVVALRPQASAAVVSVELLERCRVAALSACDELEAVLQSKRRSAVDGSVSQHGEAPFRYHEICWRGEGRYDVKCDLTTTPWSEPSLPSAL